MTTIKHHFEVCILLLTLSLLFTLFGLLGYMPVKVNAEELAGEIVIVLPTVTPVPTESVEEEVAAEPVIPETVEVYQEFNRQLGQIPLTCTKINYLNQYKVFFTAYCPEECGFRVYADGTDNFPAGNITSTGTICHRSSDFMRHQPSTCGVDPKYFPYGTMFYVPSEDRVYVAEDTGLISGAWVDTFQVDMDTMLAYEVRYEYVWTVELEDYEVLSSNYNVRPLIADLFLGIMQ